MERLLGRLRSVARRTGAPRTAGAVYVQDRLASLAERRYFDSIVGGAGERRDLIAHLACR